MRSRALSFLGALTIFAAACAPAAPAPTGGSSSSAPVPTERRSANQVLRVAKAGLPGGVSPETSSSNNEIFAAIFDTLVNYGPNFELRPAVATKWEFRQADSAWRFTLRNDMQFSNGQKLTADDVVYSVNLIVEKNTPVRGFLPSVTNAKKVDEVTVDIVTKAPDTTMLDGTPWIAIFPAAYHRDAGKDFPIKPIGSGPYELIDYKPADSIVFKLRSTPHPYRKPILSELHFRAIPELGQQISGLRTGDLDVAQSNFTADQADQLKRADMTVLTLLTENNFALFGQPEIEARNSPLRDKRVRQALNYAVNKEAMAQTLFKGFAQPVGQLSFPGTPFWDDSVKAVPFDQATAKRLLAEAGYPNGFKLPIGIEYTPQTVDPSMALFLQSALKEVGVEADVKSYEFATFLDKFYGRNGQQKGDLFFVSNGNTTPNFTSGRGRFDCDVKDFAVWWCNRQFVDLYDKAIQEGDPTKRAAMMKQANSTLREDVPVLYLVARAGFLVHNPKIKGVEFTSRNIYNYDAAYRVD